MFQAYRGNMQVRLYQDWELQTDPEAALFIADMRDAPLFAPGRWVQLGIADRGTDALLGDVGIRVVPDEAVAEIGFTLAPAAQGAGLGTEAVREVIGLVFDRSTVEQILAVTDARNLPSIRLLERVGMRRIETVAVVFKGEQCAEHIYAIRRGAY
jgi:RimJ/RimL family protein N-acetyltransferase